jgi:nucleotide-binding universal stress UspA family protein
MNPRRILFATDFSAASERARHVAGELGKTFDADVTVLHVIDGPSYPYPIVLSDAARSAARSDLDHLAAAFRCAGVRTEVAVREGYAADEIVAAANENATDLIVLGTHGRRGLSHLLMGSVADRVLRLSPVPVLTVPPHEPSEANLRPSSGHVST